MTLAILEPVLADFRPFSVAWLIQRVIDDVAENPSSRQYSQGALYSLRRLQRDPIAKKDARKLGKADIIEHCRARIKAGVCPATVNQDLSYLTGILKHAASGVFPECEEVSHACITVAKPFLVKNNLVGKAQRRKRRPTEEEITRLLDHFSKQNGHHRTHINMVEVVAFGLASARRISEVCRLTWGDIDFEKKIYWVRDLKHPTRKKGNDKSFVLWPALEEIVRRQPRLTSNQDERVFPFNSRSCSQRYTDAKRHLGIEGLRLHDNRGDCISRWLLKMPPEDVRLTLSGHDNTKILETVYDRRDSSEILQEKYQHMMVQP